MAGPFAEVDCRGAESLLVEILDACAEGRADAVKAQSCDVRGVVRLNRLDEPDLGLEPFRLRIPRTFRTTRYPQSFSNAFAWPHSTPYPLRDVRNLAAAENTRMSHSVAKITKPVLRGAIRRARLFRKLDNALRQYRVIWLGAPAGSGKTTVAASWLETRALNHIWYQLDSRDADPATFFYYLTAATRALVPRKRGALPLLKPEYALGVDAYARSFFERMGSLVPHPAILVLEDFHELPRQSPLQQLLPAAIRALPGGMSVLVLSREPPPPPLVCLLADRYLAVLPADQMNLSTTETRELLRLRGVRAPTLNDAVELHAMTQGWLAGMVLLLEAQARSGPRLPSNDLPARRFVFDYFAAEVLARAPPAAQRFLMQTAVLPQVDIESARALTSEERSEELLLDLQRRHYFTFRLPGEKPCYRYHPLFRAFLLSHARQTLTEDCFRDLVRRAAEVLVKSGNAEDAVALLLEQGPRERLAELIGQVAPALVAQGRLRQLAQWLGTLAPKTFDEDPWLSYYLGLTLSASSPEEARRHFEHAYTTFEARQNTEGLLLSWAACVDTFMYVWDTFAPLDRWILAMETRRAQGLVFPSRLVEGHVVLGMLASLMWRRPGHSEVGYWLDRAASLIQSELEAELRMRLATYLLFYWSWWTGDDARARILLERMRPLLTEPDLTPLTQLLWTVMNAAHHARRGDSKACFDAVEKGLAFAQTTGIRILSQQLAIQAVYAGLAAGDLPAARAYHQRARQFLRTSDALNLGHHLQLGAWISICNGDFREARESIGGALTLVNASGAAQSQSYGDLTLAHALIESGETTEAALLLERALAWARSTGNGVIEHHCLLSLSMACVREGRDGDAVRWLREGFRIVPVHAPGSDPGRAVGCVCVFHGGIKAT